jgi:hypothetical protein
LQEEAEGIPCKRKPKASLAKAGSSASASAEDMDITPKTDTVMAVALVPDSGNAANSEGLLDGVISSHQSRTDEQHEVMHTEIVQKTVTADIIDRFRSLDIFALSWIEHNLQEHGKLRVRSDYKPRVECIRFTNKTYKRTVSSA